MRHYAKLLHSTLTASVMLVVVAGAAVAGKLEDAKAALNRRDYTTGLRLLRPLTEQGNSAAQFVFGLLYYTGQGVPKNVVEAVKWFRKAAEQGDPNAQVMLGTMYRDGQGLPQNYTEAVKWYREAAEQGHDIAESELGVMYARGVPKNLAEAVKWWRKAAAQGNSQAERNLEQANKQRAAEEAKERDRIHSSTELGPPSRDSVGNPIMTPSEHDEATRLLNEKYRAAATQQIPPSSSEGQAFLALTAAELRSAEAKAPKDFHPKMIDQFAWPPSLSKDDLEYVFYAFGPCVIVTVETDRKTGRVTMAEVTAADENYGPTPSVVEATEDPSCAFHDTRASNRRVYAVFRIVLEILERPYSNMEFRSLLDALESGLRRNPKLGISIVPTRGGAVHVMLLGNDLPEQFRDDTPWRFRIELRQ
jgi:uncharacterized protein